MKKILWLAVALCCLAMVIAQPAHAQRVKVRVKLDGPLRGDHAVFFVARDKGYFQAEDVEVLVIEAGGPALNTLLLVSQTRFEFGVADLASLVLARATGVPVRSLAVVNQRNPSALVALKGTGLTKPRDLEGKIVGVDHGTPGSIYYRALLSAHGVDRAKITEIPVRPPYQPLLLSRAIQVAPLAFGKELPALEEAVGGATGLEILRAADWGFDVPGAGLVTSRRLLTAAPGVARRFTRAYLRGLQSVIDQPREAVAILVKSHPELADRADLLLRQLEAALPTFTSEATRIHGLGWNSPERWQRMHDAVLGAGLIPRPIDPVSSLYTNEFLGP